ncbi:DJ-1/PfpI family protein [Candidatus Micrarchaeota archaeon]|nr:DJ-1/PfpI family protein [Candidatus Micrarchaeota archaeon]
MSKILMIVAQSGFRDEELFVPREVLQNAGHDVKVASITRGKATGSRGATVTPDMAVYEANPEFFDCVVVVGGPGSPALADNGDVTKLLIAAAAKGKLIGGICLGPMALAKSGVLAGKNATIFPDRKAIALLRETASHYKAEPVVTDGKVVTADGPQSAGAFGAALAELLKGRQ